MSRLPEGWKYLPLNSIAEVRTGIAKGKKGLKNPIEVPYLRVANVQEGHLDLSEIKTIQVEEKNIERYQLMYGDVLMTEGGDFDKLGRGDIWKDQLPLCLHQNHVFSVRPNQSIINSYFLSALSESTYGKKYFLSCSKRSTNLASINSSQLKKFPILLPPLPEQHKIAQILSTWDKAITSTEKLIANSQQQKKALMQKLLTGKKRFIGFEKKWETSTLAKYCHVDTGAKDLQNKIDGGKYPFFVRSQNIELIDSYSFDGEAILIPGDGRVGEIFHYIVGKFDYHQRVYKISNFMNIDGKFTYYYLMQFFKKEVNKNSVKATVDSLRMPIFTQMIIKIPSLAEQKKIALVLSTLDTQITSLQTQLKNLKQEKKALMQQLLTGKRRVSFSKTAA